MQVTAHVHALRLPFHIPLPNGRNIERHAYSYILTDGESVWIVDAGVSGSRKIIYEYIERLGRSPRDIRRLVLTLLRLKFYIQLYIIIDN